MNKIFYLACLFVSMTDSIIFSMQKSTLRRRGEALVQATTVAIGAGVGARAGMRAGCEAVLRLTSNAFYDFPEQGVALSILTCPAGALPACCCCGALGAVIAYKANKQIQKAMEINKKQQ